MYLNELTIEGYKCFKEPFSIRLAPGLNVLVGENGSGKSAVIDAVRLLLLEDEFGRSPVSDRNFHRPFDDPSNEAKAFRLNGAFSGLSSEEKVAFLPWMDCDESASLTLLVDNKPNHYGRYKRALWGGASKASLFEWDLFDTITCIYLPPLRDAEAKLREGKSSRLARLIKNLNHTELKEAKASGEKHPLEKKVQEFNQQLAADDDQTIAKANKLIRKRLLEALGSVLGQDTHIQFSEVNFGRIVESLRLLFYPDAKEGTPKEMFRSLEENSLGYNNLLYLATVLAEITEKSDEPEYLRTLLIEEPEAHLHPQLQIRLLKYLEKTAKDKGVQVIVTTHSPELASSVSLNSLIHLSAVNQPPRAIPLSKCGLSPQSQSFVNRWLDATKSTLLFARGVILVEGIAEAMLLPEMAKHILTSYNQGAGQGKELPESLEDAGVSVVNMNGIYFRHFMQFFIDVDGGNNSNIPIRCAGITDNDPPTDSKPTPSKPIVGENPSMTIIDGVNKSEWGRLFINKLKTFEYDLAMEGENIAVLASIEKKLRPKDGPVKTKFQEYIGADWKKANEEEKADAAYYILEHINKGEFAQELADHIADKGNVLRIPEYIRSAVIWSCGGTLDDK